MHDPPRWALAGSKSYIPDAEQPDPSKQALPGAHENSGCSYEFRYAESREDVSVLNHTRVHLSYKGKTLKMRLQQTSAGENKEWYQCFDMRDVDLPSPAFFGISAATGDLVDNHDIIQFVVRPLAGVDDPETDYDAWELAEKMEKTSQLKEFDLRPPEALQRDYQRVLRAQVRLRATRRLARIAQRASRRRMRHAPTHAARARPAGVCVGAWVRVCGHACRSPAPDAAPRHRRTTAQAEAIKVLTADVETLKQQLEFQLSSIATGVSTTKKNLDDKAEQMGAVSIQMKAADSMHQTIESNKQQLRDLKKAMDSASGGSGWRFPFFILFIMILGLAGVGYNRYVKLYGKSHLP